MTCPLHPMCKYLGVLHSGCILIAAARAVIPVIQLMASCTVSLCIIVRKIFRTTYGQAVYHRGNSYDPLDMETCLQVLTTGCARAAVAYFSLPAVTIIPQRRRCSPVSPWSWMAAPCPSQPPPHTTMSSGTSPAVPGQWTPSHTSQNRCLS